MKRRTQPKDYAPGHFCEFVRRHNWPPGFVPRVELSNLEAQRSAAGRHAREIAAQSGTGWHNNTVAESRHSSRPVMMPRPK
ncbi:MAG: hypothetical protein ACO3GP_03235 [Candidatus Limnocylindrus sp.]